VNSELELAASALAKSGRGCDDSGSQNFVEKIVTGLPVYES
jgi:hypothetical protein